MQGNPFDQLEAPVRDLHHEAGWAGRVYTDEFGGETDRGTAEWIEDETGAPATIRIEWPEQAAAYAPGGTGRVVEGDVLIHVDTQEVDVYDGSEGPQTRASVIEDERNGKQYRVLRIRDQNYGIVTADAEVTD